MATYHPEALLDGDQPGPWSEPVPISYSQRDVLLYAVGIGCTDLRFVFEGHPQHAVFPSFAIRWAGAGYEWELVATFGERIALDRLALAGETPDGIRWEADVLRLTEVDAAGRIRASVSFDDDDRRAAFLEAHARFAAGEAAAAGGQAPFVALNRAYAASARDDWAGVRECLADEFMYNDRRTLGLGMFSRDQWIESLRALYALAPDMFVESFRILTWDRHGRVDVQRSYGTMPSGGGPFENVFIRVIVTDGDRIRHYELFDIGAVEPALARFEELCAAVG